MANNKQRREELEAIYGKGCMFEKSKAEEYVSSLPRIKGFKVFIKERHFTSKEIAQLKKRMNYHHLEHRADGGQTTLENGAVISELAHRYIHSLPRDQEEIINNHIRKWKLDVVSLTTEAVIESQEIDIDLSKDYIELPAVTYRKKNKKQLEEEERRKEKRELQKLKKEYETR